MTVSTSTGAGINHRWNATRYSAGDEVVYKSGVWEVYRVDIVRGSDSHARVMYRLRRAYRDITKKSKPLKYTYAWVPASKVKLHARADKVQEKKRRKAKAAA